MTIEMFPPGKRPSFLEWRECPDIETWLDEDDGECHYLCLAVHADRTERGVCQWCPARGCYEMPPDDPQEEAAERRRIIDGIVKGGYRDEE